MKGKGKKGFWSKRNGKAKGKGKKGKGYHWNFAKGKSKGVLGGKPEGENKGKGKGLLGQKGSSGPQGKQCWTCGGFGHFENACPTGRVNAIEVENFQKTWSEDDWTSWNASREDFDENWTVNFVSDGRWDFQDYSYDESWYDNSWGNSWGWHSYQEPLWNSKELSAGSGTKATLEQASAVSSAAGTVQTLQPPLPPQASVSAVTSQPSKTLTSRTPSAKNSPMANVALLQP